MALSGITIYKLLPQTNCKACGFPTCLAFAMKLAAKQVELSNCPHVTEEARAQLAASAEPPVRLIEIRANGHSVQAGNEIVLFRHEKTFYHKPGVFLRLQSNRAHGDLAEAVRQANDYRANYVGRDLELDGFAIQAAGPDEGAFANAVATVRQNTPKPIVLISRDPAVMEAGLRAIDGERPLLHAADESNWEAMAGLAGEHSTPLAVTAQTLDGLAELTQKVKEKGIADIVLDPAGRGFSESLARATKIRRLAIKQNFRALGYPLIAFPGEAEVAEMEAPLAAQAIAKYAGFIVLDTFAPEALYPLLVLRENIYTDPQKPIQVQPGLYEFNNPTPQSPVLATTNFSITYFSVANEVESAGLPAWLLVADAEGMSVLTAWAAGKFDAERIAKDVRRFEVEAKVTRRRIVLPGQVAVLSGELEEELPDWEVKVGPREAVDIPAYLKQALD
jgi:acetyl-CoA decarbonylase/synthase complex subunit gamma